MCSSNCLLKIIIKQETARMYLLTSANFLYGDTFHLVIISRDLLNVDPWGVPVSKLCMKNTNESKLEYYSDIWKCHQHLFFSFHKKKIISEKNVNKMHNYSNNLCTPLNSFVIRSYNYFHNILRHFDVLRNFPFTTSETIHDYYL